MEGVNSSLARTAFTWEQRGHLHKAGLCIMSLPSGRLLQEGWEVSFGATGAKYKVSMKEYYILCHYIIITLGKQITRKRMKTYEFGELASLNLMKNK